MMNFIRFQKLISDDFEKNILEDILRLSICYFGGDEGSLLLFTDQGKELENVMSCTKERVNEEPVGRMVEVSKGVIGLAVQTMEPQIGSPVYKDLQLKNAIDNQSDDNTSLLAVPLLYKEELLGIMTIVDYDLQKTFDLNDMKHYVAMGSLLAILLHKQTLISELTDCQGDEQQYGSEAEVFKLLGEIVDQSPQRMKSLIVLLEGIKGLQEVGL